VVDEIVKEKKRDIRRKIVCVLIRNEVESTWRNGRIKVLKN
jgi:hypothetical protein